MDFHRLTSLFEQYPAFGLVRAHKAPLITSFLHQEFKEKTNYRVPYFDLSKRLTDYMEFLQDEPEQHETSDNNLRARLYLDRWTDRGFLIKAPDEKTGEHYIELSSTTEKVLNWIEDALHQQRFVGTESRFRDIFRKLKEVVEYSIADPELRLNQLEQEKARLEQEMEHIRLTGQVKIMEKHQVEENFIEISRMAKSLLADFKEVEKNFQRIGRNIYEKQTELIYTKGSLLEIALNAWVALKEEEQGKSFYAFWNFLQSDAQKEELRHLIQQLYQLLDTHEITYGEDQFLKHLKRNLHNSGTRVLESNDRLAEKLNRVLAEKSLLERLRILELIKDIKQAALRVINDPPEGEYFMELPVFEADIKLPLNKRMVLGPEEDIVIESRPEEEQQAPDLSKLFNQFFIDKKELENRIHRLLSNQKSVSLKEVITQYPIEQGLSEVVTYFAIASQHPRHEIMSEEEEIIFRPLLGEKIKAPKIIFNQ
nr:DUF3375 domain-containing protein [uncultured Chitinophaga sp.]